MPKKKKSPEAGKRLFTGRLEMTKGGMGFVIVEGLQKDILIKRDKLDTALDGDEVRLEVRGYYDNNKRMEGEVTAVLRRRQTEFSGVVEVHPHFAFLLPDSSKMPVDIYIPLHLLNGAVTGDKAIARIVDWSGKNKNPVGEIVSVLTNESQNELAMQGLLIENGFPLSFPDDVLEEAARYNEHIDSAEVSKRRDMRSTFTITIDPADAKDFDDAISYKELGGGLYEVGVHIADVSHYVQAGSALDKEAYRRATSVYLPDRVLPMLPERLSNELCSLRPNEDKYTFSAVFVMDKTGKVTDTWLGRTLTHSNRRYAYEEVQAVIEGGDDEHRAVLLQLNEIARSLRAARFAKGAINFSSQEVRFKLDEHGKPIGIMIKESKEAHQLIEELMLLANRTVATYVSGITIKDKPIPFAYRVHDVPDEDKLAMFAVFAAQYGITFNLSSGQAIAASFNKMLETVTGKPEQHVLEQLGVRTMAKAVYTTENIGHYGLGFDYYCHFTSPIRRYPDVLVHRVLQECLDKDIHPVKNMESLCRHCSDQERRAMEAERAANKYKQVEYMQDFIGDEFEAVISGVATFGFWAETVAHKCEGLVSITDLSEIDEFQYIEDQYSLVGRHTGMRFGMGDTVKVRVVSTNLMRRQIDYSLAEAPRSRKRSIGPRSMPQGRTNKAQAKQKQKNSKNKRKR